MIIIRCVEENTDNVVDDVRQTPTIITPGGGEVPKEISMALRRIPIKTDINKPLGSNENPIQLVQQGSTFHRLVEKSVVSFLMDTGFEAGKRIKFLMDWYKTRAWILWLIE